MTDDDDGDTGWRRVDASQIEGFVRQQLQGWLDGSLHIACHHLGFTDAEAHEILDPAYELFVKRFADRVRADMLSTMDEPEHLT